MDERRPPLTFRLRQAVRWWAMTLLERAARRLEDRYAHAAIDFQIERDDD